VVCSVVADIPDTVAGGSDNISRFPAPEDLRTFPDSTARPSLTSPK
jgi:hypothetical protein